MPAVRPQNWLLAACVAVVLAFAGCATVPTSGPVENHSPQAAGVNSGVRVDPLPPADGASQLLVVEGFLHAMGTYQPDYAVARQYLTESAAKAWHPESGVQVYADGFPPTETETSVVLSVRLTGTVDAVGSYAPVGNEAPLLRQDFDLVKNEAGQWRINNPPAGLLVSRYAFTTGFVGASLFFADPDGSVLVPDPRFFAAGEQAPEEAVRALLAGPSAWLAPAVRKAVAGLTVTEVVVDSSGLADVALGGSAARLTGDQRRTLLAELVETLTGIGQVNAIRVTAGEDIWRDDSGQAVIHPDAFSDLSPVGPVSQRTLYVLKDRKVQRLSDPSTWDDFADVEVGLPPRPGQVAVSRLQDEVAATTADGTRLSTGKIGSDKLTVLRTGGTGLLRPAYARDGELWSPAASGPAGLEVFKGGQRLKVRSGTDPVPDSPVRALSISPDGVRVALILSRGGRGVVGLARVERSEGQVTLSGWKVVDLPAITGNPGAAMDLGWVSATDLVVLSAGEDETSVLRVSQDGAAATDIGPSEALQLTQLAVAPQRQVVAKNPDGTVYRRDGEFNWNLAVAAVDSVVYSG